MFKIALLVACLNHYTGLARRVQAHERSQSLEDTEEKNVLANLLLSVDPATAFQLSTLGGRVLSSNQDFKTSGSTGLSFHRRNVDSQGMPSVSMQDLPVPESEQSVSESEESLLPVPKQPVEMPKVDPDSTYNIMMKTILKTNASLSREVKQNYELFDWAFLTRLEDQIKVSKEEDRERLNEFMNAINEEMAVRMGQAAETLQDLLKSPSQVIMEGKMAALVRRGKVDNALLDLIDGNIQGAKEAGEAGANAVKVMTALKKLVAVELDQKVKPEVALIRFCMRTDSADDRKSMLRKKMAPKAGTSILLAGMSKKEEEKMKDQRPDVSPSDLVQELKMIKTKFGNVDNEYDSGFIKRIDEIIEEAEEVARELADGKEVTLDELHDKAWNEDRVSVWDLAAVEEEAHQDGKMAMWEQEAQDQFERENQARQQSSETDLLR